MPTDLPPPPEIPDGLEHLLPLFVAEMDKDAAILRDMIDAGHPGLGEHAHGMRGKAGLFGERQLYDLLTRIEELCLTGDGVTLPALSEQVLERARQLRFYDGGPR